MHRHIVIAATLLLATMSAQAGETVIAMPAPPRKPPVPVDVTYPGAEADDSAQPTEPGDLALRRYAYARTGVSYWYGGGPGYGNYYGYHYGYGSYPYYGYYPFWGWGWSPFFFGNFCTVTIRH